MSAFTVNPEKLIEIKIHYLEGEDGQLVILSEDFSAQIPGKYKTAIAKFSRASWGMFNNYVQKSYIYKVDSNSHTIDEIALKYNKFRSLLKSLMDGDGIPVVLDEQFFHDVNPDLLVSLVNTYDETIAMEGQKMIAKLLETPEETEK